MKINMNSTPHDGLEADLYFLARNPRYNHEKPYSMRYPPHISIDQSNILHERHTISIHNMRPHLEDLDFNECGFGLMSLESQMSYEDFKDQSKIHTVYLEELKQALKKDLGASHVYISDHVVREDSAIYR